MTEHQPLPVAGYTAQPQEKVDAVNNMKRTEEAILQMLDNMPPDCDKRWLAIGRTHIEQAFMAINRSIFKPQRIDL